jgi:hypothetical protein
MPNDVVMATSEASRGNQDASNPRLVVAGVKSPPAIFQINLKPGAEVHDSRDGDTDVAQIPVM